MRNAAVDPLPYIRSNTAYDGHSRDPSNYTSNPIRVASIVHAFVANVTFATVAAAIKYTGMSREGWFDWCASVPSHFCQNL